LTAKSRTAEKKRVIFEILDEVQSHAQLQGILCFPILYSKRYMEDMFCPAIQPQKPIVMRANRAL
jgi:hypothetical protein